MNLLISKPIDSDALLLILAFVSLITLAFSFKIFSPVLAYSSPIDLMLVLCFIKNASVLSANRWKDLLFANVLTITSLANQVSTRANNPDMWWIFLFGGGSMFYCEKSINNIIVAIKWLLNLFILINFFRLLFLFSSSSSSYLEEKQ